MGRHAHQTEILGLRGQTDMCPRYPLSAGSCRAGCGISGATKPLSCCFGVSSEAFESLIMPVASTGGQFYRSMAHQRDQRHGPTHISMGSERIIRPHKSECVTA